MKAQHARQADIKSSFWLVLFADTGAAVYLILLPQDKFWQERNLDSELNYLTKVWSNAEDGDVVIKYAPFYDMLW